MRASARSTLLTTRMTGSRASSALRNTKRVWGSGPSLASTSRSTPSTMVRPRSTSPPKSACPGVSTMLIFVSPYRTAVFFARIVMPFSRSRSFESRTRSATSWLARNAPVCQSIASTSVVLPWSTWATIATLRRSARVRIARAFRTVRTEWSSAGRSPPSGAEGAIPKGGASSVREPPPGWDADWLIAPMSVPTQGCHGSLAGGERGVDRLDLGVVGRGGLGRGARRGVDGAPVLERPDEQRVEQDHAAAQEHRDAERVRERLLRPVDEVVRALRVEALRGLHRARDRRARRVTHRGRERVELADHLAAVHRRHHRTEHCDPERAPELAREVVDGRTDARLRARDGTHDQRGRGRGRLPVAETDEDEPEHDVHDR